MFYQIFDPLNFYFSENPINCDCDQQELWEWIRDHQKLTSDLSTKGLICQHPLELRGRKFMELEPPTFCAMPVVLKLAIQDIQPYSIFVSWKGRNHTGLHGYRVAYYPIEDPDYPAAAISTVAVTPNVSPKLFTVTNHYKGGYYVQFYSDIICFFFFDRS